MKNALFKHVLRSMAIALVATTMPIAPARAASPVADGQPFPPAKAKALDAAFDSAFAQSGAPGAVVGIWIPNEGSYVATRGVSDRATRSPMRADDRFRIGSITKTFTVTALLILADDQKLGLDDPVGRYLSWVPDGNAITLRMLANMTSGLFNYTEDEAWVKQAFGNVERVWTPRELADVGLAHRPYFAPGTGFHYSNTNTILLGMIIEQVVGKPVQEFFAERMFRPLALKETTWPLTAAMPSPYAHGMTTQTLDGAVADASHWFPSWAFTAGELISTMADLRVWVESYATGSLISPALQKERLTFVTFPPNTAVRKYGLGIGSESGWLGHSGELPGYNTGAYYLPDRKAVIVVMVNSDIPAADGVNPMTVIFKRIAAEAMQ